MQIVHEYSAIRGTDDWRSGHLDGEQTPLRLPVCALGPALEMLAQNGSCDMGPSLTYLSCLMEIILDWLELDNLEDYLNYLDYLMWVFTPLIIVFVLPFIIVIFLYLSILFLHVYKRKNELKEAYSNSIWDGARKTLATLWDGHAAIWHGYEICGLEKIPENGPALIVYYHGALPVDYYYFVAKVILLKGRTCHSVGDHFLFKVPGFKPLLEVFSVIHGPKEECVKALKDGHLLAISPGGVREALFSDESYILMWGNRTGFAQVAIDAQVCIIPMFTQNVREGFRSLGCLRIFRWLYETYKIPFVPVYGGFPVKFRTYLGDPIQYDPNITANELAEKTKCALQSLIDRHQKIPGNIFQALLERFHRRAKEE
ncbi:DGAT1/2-independent enzyme synthesizing storage lipids [Phyllobates terribilis]|uniref:DGAT1/2-independent enzyme synthesizing storage lipids n=1 Tax=Phyllobates terribilis TaxID=111132 RepID=UPI003CCA8E42